MLFLTTSAFYEPTALLNTVFQDPRYYVLTGVRLDMGVSQAQSREVVVNVVASEVFLSTIYGRIRISFKVMEVRVKRK